MSSSRHPPMRSPTDARAPTLDRAEHTPRRRSRRRRPQDTPWLSRCVTETMLLCCRLILCADREGIPEAAHLPKRQGAWCVTFILEGQDGVVEGGMQAARSSPRRSGGTRTSVSATRRPMRRSLALTSVRGPVLDLNIHIHRENRQEVPLHWWRVYPRTHSHWPCRLDQDDTHNHHPSGLPPLHRKVQCVLKLLFIASCVLVILHSDLLHRPLREAPQEPRRPRLPRIPCRGG